MGKASSLTSLCLEALKHELLRGDDLLGVVYDIPSNLFELLVLGSPPLILHKLQVNFEDRSDDCYDDYGRGNGRKRGRSSNFSKAWRDLFELRWPKLVDTKESVDWQQIYWETHVQNCLDEAAAVALLPSFEGSLGDIVISDDTLKHMGGHMKSFTCCDYSKLSYHLQEFGHYARRLSLHNVFYGPETSHLLKTSRLQSLVLEWIRSKEQIGGVCELLSQNRESLSTLEFSHCMLSLSSIDEICGSLTTNSMPIHRIKEFSISSSRFDIVNPVPLPLRFVSFLSSGRSLCSLKFSDNSLGPSFADMVFNTLSDVSSGVSTLDLSDNNITGWLVDFNPRFSNNHPTSPEFGNTWQSLRVLNIRGNSLVKDDAIGLRYALIRMPKLEVLDISDNLFESDGIRCLLPYFVEASEKGYQFAALHVENCELSDDGVIDLVNCLATLLRPLKFLSIANNVVGSKVAETLGNFLSTSIQVLNISGIGLGSNGFQALQQSLAEELKLVEINFSKNYGGIGAAKFLSAILSRGPGLVRVDAAHNFMPLESSDMLCSALNAFKGNLEHLNLKINNVDIQTVDIQRITEVLLSRVPASNAPYDHDP